MQLSPDFFFFFSKHIDSPNCNLQGKERELEMKVFILSQKATPTTKTMNQPNSNPNNQKPQTKKQPQTNEKKKTMKKEFSVRKGDCRHRIQLVLLCLYWQGHQDGRSSPNNLALLDCSNHLDPGCMAKDMSGRDCWIFSATISWRLGLKGSLAAALISHKWVLENSNTCSHSYNFWTF